MIIFKGKKEKWSQLITKCISLCAKSVQWCPTVCGPMDGSPLGSSVHGILQARLLEWVAMPSSRGSSWPRDQTWGSPTLQADSSLSEPPRFRPRMDWRDTNVQATAKWFKILNVPKSLQRSEPSQTYTPVVQFLSLEASELFHEE